MYSATFLLVTVPSHILIAANPPGAVLRPDASLSGGRSGAPAVAIAVCLPYESEMNPVIEHDIMHVGRVMRANIVQCAPEMILYDYWRARLNRLLATPDLTYIQRRTVYALIRELSSIERDHARRMGPVILTLGM
ncbi:hypothetical protein [Paraburkholderia steynii]|uniref:hypothetical protein n=1 Tax=Paraburkholderia steynii TaxID=1245441 RepID=UPI0014227F42|nr:hypothetical protein [Paraburkholderia steynii]